MKGTAQTSNFFSAENNDAKTARENIAMEVLDELLEWLRDGGDVAVFDATNTTDERRQAVLARCKVGFFHKFCLFLLIHIPGFVSP